MIVDAHWPCTTDSTWIFDVFCIISCDPQLCDASETAPFNRSRRGTAREAWKLQPWMLRTHSRFGTTCSSRSSYSWPWFTSGSLPSGRYWPSRCRGLCSRVLEIWNNVVNQEVIYGQLMQFACSSSASLCNWDLYKVIVARWGPGCLVFSLSVLRAFSSIVAFGAPQFHYR